MSFSSSSARLQGDDYQHLFAWYQALRALIPGGDVSGIAIEAENAGFLDDVVVRCTRTPDEYWQVKYSVDASNPLDTPWLLRVRGSGTSPLQKLWNSWILLTCDGSRPRMGFFSNRDIHPEDPVLCLKDGLRGQIGRRMREQGDSKAWSTFRHWVDHLQVEEPELLEMMDHVVWRTSQGPTSGLEEAVADRMNSLGLRYDACAVEQGVTIARKWASSGRREISRQELTDEVGSRQLHAGQPHATLLNQAIDRDPYPDAATVSVDWVDAFIGNEAKLRRRVHAPTVWNSRFGPELAQAAAQLRKLGQNRVLVRGAHRLTPAFVAGVELPDTRGLHVLMDQRGQIWSSDVTAADYPLKEELVNIGTGAELALALSLTHDCLEDVKEYAQQARLGAGQILHIFPARGIGRDSVGSGEECPGWADGVKKLAIRMFRREKAKRIHLFLAGPRAAALMLGHIWNGLPDTQLYEDLLPGYTQSFLVAGT